MGYVDAREACRLAVEAAFTGHERVIVASADNITGHPSAELVAVHFPASPVHGTLAGDVSWLSSAHAAEVIGYAPRFGWRGMVA